MIISNGVTDLTYLGTQYDDFLNIEQSSTRTTGGSTRTIRSGKRYIVSERIRISGAELEELTDLLLDGSNDYYYTPTKLPDYIDSTKFPMSAKIEIANKTGQDGGGGTKNYHVLLNIEGADYI